jgi:uncharacterized protein YfdQ (DUF2303 family)
MGRHEEGTEIEGQPLTASLGHMGGDAAVIRDITEATFEPVEISPDKLYVLRQADGTLKPTSLERYRPTPDRIRGTYEAATVESFTDYVREWATDKTTVWVHPTSASVIAVINDGDMGADAIGWRDHRVELKLLPTPEWTFWKDGSGKPMNQQQFAEHIEDGMSQIVDPSAATMLELAQSLHVKTNVQFRSQIELQDGSAKLQYDEEVEGSAGNKGQIVIPETFELALAPYVGEDSFKLKARFRYRPQGGKLTLGYKLMDMELAERTILEEIAKNVRSGIGALGKVYLGAAPAPLSAQS